MVVFAYKWLVFMVWFWFVIIDMIVLMIYGKLLLFGIGKYIGLVGLIIFLVFFFVVLFIIIIVESKK